MITTLEYVAKIRDDKYNSSKEVVIVLDVFRAHHNSEVQQTQY